MEEYFSNKYPQIYNSLSKKVGDMFYPYTSIPDYDRLIYDRDYTNRKMRYGRVVEMSPQRYIDEAYKGFNGANNAVYNENFSKSRMIDHRLADESYKKIKNMIKSGKKLWMPYLNYGKKATDFSQEGLHRALALKELGIEKMPVVVSNEGARDSLKRVMSKALRFGKVLYGLPLAEMDMVKDNYKILDYHLTKDKQQKINKARDILKEYGYNVKDDGTIVYPPI